MEWEVNIQTWTYWNNIRKSPSLFKSFLNNRFQRVALNGHLCSNWSSVLAGVPQHWILETLLFLIYINDLPEDLESSVKLFADGTSLFSTVYNPNMSADQLDQDLKKNQNSPTNGKWSLTYYSLVLLFYTPWKHHKT